jgi:uncharacterized protein YndB with AHSA1/START domain
MNDIYTTKPGTSPEQATVRLERMLPGPIERVWAYLTDSEKRKTWFAAGVFDLRVGGKADLHFDHSCFASEAPPPEMKDKRSDWAGTITRIDPPRLLAYTFEAAGPESEVTFELETRGKGVLLTITHRRLANRNTMISVAGGWDAHVGILEDRLNGVAPRPFWSTHARLKKEYEALL